MSGLSQLICTDTQGRQYFPGNNRHINLGSCACI